MDQVDSVGLFSSPKKLYNLADSATSAVTTDSELDSVSDLVGLAKMVKGIKSDDIQMSTLPVTYDPADPQPRRADGVQGAEGVVGDRDGRGRYRSPRRRGRRGTGPTSAESSVAAPLHPRGSRPARACAGGSE